MSIIDSLKKEARERDAEKYEAKVFLEEEQKRIAEERRQSRENRSFIRKKIKFIDDRASQKEAREDREKLEHIRVETEQKIKRARSERKAKLVRHNKKPITIAIVSCLAIIGVGSFAWYSIQNSNMEETYATAINYILEEDYQSAIDTLEKVDTDDSKDLIQYSKYQLDIESYKGRAKLFNSNLGKLGEFNNEEAQQQETTAEEQSAMAANAQNMINSLNTSSVNLSVEEDMDSIGNELAKITDRYLILVDSKKYEAFETAIDNIKNNTPAGKTIVAIDSLGNISLKSDNDIKGARELYDDLSNDEQSIVINYHVLRSAEDKYAELEREEKEKKASELAIAEDADEDNDSSRSTPQSVSITVYRTATGDKYHVSGCRYLRGNGIALTLDEAIAMGLSPCSVCRP